MSMGQLTVRTTLTLAFGALATIVLLVSGIALKALGDGHADYARYVGETSARLALAHTVLDATNARAVAARNLVLVQSPADRAAEQAAVGKAHEQVTSAMAQLRDNIARAPNIRDGERALFAEIQRVEARYGPVALDIVRLALADQRDAATARMNADCRPLLAELVRSVHNYLADGQAAAAASVQQADAAHVTNRNLLVGACALAVGLALGLALVITRGLTRALGAEPTQLSAAARRVADGDLGVVVGADRAPATSVMASLAHMQASLVKVVAQVRNSADSIATGSSQIATGNADLSQRTEEQASNLQQTAASMEQISATVRNNADTALQASTLASSASAAAAKGGQVVAQVVATMNEITSSSRQIVDIIGVIDGIAFQTNILALNAAVEAARAGEQGRGFAVVAGEVRSLAQRSAEAAKSIKSLIGTSVERVETGARLVDAAGASMGDIVAQVGQVAGLIGDISAATVEQTTGIGQVSDAVNQLDQVTQQNAALVEQSAAAAESLQRQANRLTEVVALFKLQDGAAVPRLAQAMA